MHLIRLAAMSGFVRIKGTAAEPGRFRTRRRCAVLGLAVEHQVLYVIFRATVEEEPAL